MSVVFEWEVKSSLVFIDNDSKGGRARVEPRWWSESSTDMEWREVACDGVGRASERDTHHRRIRNCALSSKFGRMHDWTSVTTYSVRTFKTFAYQRTDTNR